MNTIKLCNINKIYRNRFVFVDEEDIYYFWYIDFSDYGATLEIITFKNEKGQFVKIEVKNKVKELVKYLKYKLLGKNEKRIKEFFYYLSDLEFKIPKNIVNKLGERFCKYFLRDMDDEFIFLDTDAKHWIIDFEKIRNKEDNFLKEPDLFPFFIPEVEVTLTQDARLLKNGNEISIENFWKLCKEYKISLIPAIKKKDKVLRKIELDLEKRFVKSFEELKSKKISDYEIDPKVEVFDTLLECDPVMTLYYGKNMFEDKEPYNLQPFGIDLKVGRLCWYVLDSLGLRSIHIKFSYWSEIEIKNQKFFVL